jgi:phage N-6-adenine-methyltransferase
MVDHFSSKTPEWYTPQSVIGRVIATFGGEIDCDPCADPNDNVPARVRYTEDDDGLGQTWSGDVYMNPPYGRQIGKWVEKAYAEYVDGRADNVVMLLPARVDTAWWRTAAFSANGIAIIRGRLTFSTFSTPAPFPSAVIYLGNDLPAFRKAFAPTFADHYECAPVAYSEVVR